MRRRFLIARGRALVPALVVALATALVVAAGPVRRVAPALWNGPERLPALPDTPQVHYQPGAAGGARAVAALVPEAVATEEAALRRPFARPTPTGVYRTDEAFAAASAGSRAAGVTLLGHVVLSPALVAEGGVRLAAILTHELAHAHLQGAMPGLTFFRPARRHSLGRRRRRKRERGRGARGHGARRAHRGQKRGVLARPFGDPVQAPRGGGARNGTSVGTRSGADGLPAGRNVRDVPARQQPGGLHRHAGRRHRRPAARGSVGGYGTDLPGLWSAFAGNE